MNGMSTSRQSVQPSNRFAFKEWAAVCAALDSGRQTLILRKGGLHEGPTNEIFTEHDAGGFLKRPHGLER